MSVGRELELAQASAAAAGMSPGSSAVQQQQGLLAPSSPGRPVQRRPGALTTPTQVTRTVPTAEIQAGAPAGNATTNAAPSISMTGTVATASGSVGSGVGALGGTLAGMGVGSMGLSASSPGGSGAVSSSNLSSIAGWQSAFGYSLTPSQIAQLGSLGSLGSLPSLPQLQLQQQFAGLNIGQMDHSPSTQTATPRM